MYNALPVTDPHSSTTSDERNDEVRTFDDEEEKKVTDSHGTNKA